MPTYIAFAADGNEDMYNSDIHYYQLMKGWDAMKKMDFKFINPHEKGAALREWSKKETIKRTLSERLKISNRLFLLVGNTTRLDTDFVPFEIEYATDTCKLPVIVCYVSERKRLSSTVPDRLVNLLPRALKQRMDNDVIKTIHIPFRQRIIAKAIQGYNKNNLPTYAFSVYTDDVYDSIYKPGEI